MKEITYQDAVELMAFARTNDVQIAIRADRYSFCEIKRMTEAGAIFLVPDDPKPEPKAPEAPAPEAPKRRAIDKGKVMALHNAGWSAAKIADELQCSTQTVYAIISKAKQEQKEMEVTA